MTSGTYDRLQSPSFIPTSLIRFTHGTENIRKSVLVWLYGISILVPASCSYCPDLQPALALGLDPFELLTF
jgi:hypothetical protein